MGKISSKSFHLFSVSLASVIMCIFMLFSVSCTQVVPEVKYSNLSVVFEYKNENALPTARLCVFVESISDARRFENINIKAVENGFTWDVSDVVKIKSYDRMYAGNTTLIVPDGEKIPTGEYNITFYNADAEKVESKTVLTYDSEFYDSKSGDIPEMMRKRGGKKNIAIYDKEGKLIYYGERTDKLDDTRKIWNKYRNAGSFNEVWKLPNNSVICVMPLEQVVPSND